jgi:hypothetical protein
MSFMANSLKILAATPLCDLIPNPTTDIFEAFKLVLATNPG